MKKRCILGGVAKAKFTYPHHNARMVVAEPLDLDLLPIYFNGDRGLEMGRIVRHSSTLVCEIWIDVQPSGLPGREEVDRHYPCGTLETVALALRRDSLCFRRTDLIESRRSSVEPHAHDVPTRLRPRRLEPTAREKRVTRACRRTANVRGVGRVGAAEEEDENVGEKQATDVHDGTSWWIPSVPRRKHIPIINRPSLQGCGWTTVHTYSPCLVSCIFSIRSRQIGAFFNVLSSSSIFLATSCACWMSCVSVIRAALNNCPPL